MIAAEPVAARALAERWYHPDQALSTRIGVLAGLIWGDKARNATVCTQAELDEYAAYIIEARLVDFLTDQAASEAMGFVYAMQARIDVQAAFDRTLAEHEASHAHKE
jgi:hypothetical protein